MKSIPSSICSTTRAAAFPRVFSTLRARTWLLALCGVLGVMVCGAWSASSAQTATPTSTTMTVTSGGGAATTVSSGSVVTLTATVTAGITPVTPGLVNFCDAVAAFCGDIHLMGSAQLTAAGTASVKFRPGIGSHNYKAVFVGTKTYTTSASGAAALSVAGTSNPSTTTIAQSGIEGNYTVTATVTGLGLLVPAGNVSFLDTSNANAVLWTEPLAAGQESVGWLNPQSPASFVDPKSVVVGDFNGDGMLDLVVGGEPNRFIPSVNLMIGNGDGTFTTSTLFPNQLTYAYSVAVGDFNGDGKADLVVSGYGWLDVLLGNGDGTFSSPTTVYSGDAVGYVAVGDFNGDGIPDLAMIIPTSDGSNNTIKILLGKGDGTFTPVAASPVVGSMAGSIAVGDFNGDGKADLAVTNQIDNTISYGASSVAILLGNGDGTFTAAPTITNPPVQPRSVVIGDFNGDGIPDLAVSGYTTQIFLGKGDGTFQYSTILYSSGSSITVGDFNGDGNADLAMVWPDTYTVSAYFGKGDGTFIEGSSPSTGEFPWAIAAGDFNGDGAADLAVTNADGDTVTVLTSQLTQTATATASDVSIAGHGVHQVDASYAGDSNFSLSVSGTAGLTAAPSTPTINWATPAPITYGAALSATQLDATSPVAGTFTYSPAAGAVLTGGPQTITATFTPTDTLDYTTATATVTQTVNEATPAISWATPAAIPYGTPLGASQLNASSTAAGTFAYSPSAGTVLGAGTQTLTTNFTPSNTADYTTATSTVTLTVNKATPTINWTAPTAISYGTALSVAQLDATALVAGTFTYSTATGTVLGAGSHTITATFTPTDSADYTGTTGSVTLVVNQATPAITWPTPTAISYGTALGAAQLDASSPVAGSFAYSPAAGAVLVAGQQTLKVTFTPTDTTDYTTASATVTLMVNDATPTITWPTPAAITYGAGLGSAQLDATSSVAGSFTYSPASGTVLGAGPQTLTATFSPTDATDYTTATKIVTLTVNQATPTINWATPVAITAGTALSATQLDATAAVPGTFVYNPPLGTTPAVGSDTLSVTFTPTDNVDYATATDSVTLTVNFPANPLPFLGNITPAITDAGGAGFTITVSGSGFLANSTVYWGTTALATQFVSSTQLTATVTAAAIAIPGATAVNVQTPAPGGGTSDVLQFEVDSPSATATSPSVPGTVVTVAAGTTATYSISFPTSVTNATATCLNLPAGAICSYSFATGVLTISTSSTTPTGTYQVTVVFNETVANTSSAFILLPFVLLPLVFLRKRLTSRGIWPAVWLGVILLAATAFSVGCGGSSSPVKTTTTQSVTSSGVVGMVVQ